MTDTRAIFCIPDADVESAGTWHPIGGDLLDLRFEPTYAALPDDELALCWVCAFCERCTAATDAEWDMCDLALTAIEREEARRRGE